ncbi:SHOCT domain-containing protein [Halosimplex litoreum]|uniref:SHOCT domain-containing protein n=1 Tax=Halosimplex litoreum TaxID=1198301 RepID=A0A7T3FWF8_9EURY|nr:SHOCT domain-containing protein [Halosimplex litoreum]QPV61892.1 SHOCT domain-containing protein [Halosimplex litoreum]
MIDTIHLLQHGPHHGPGGGAMGAAGGGGWLGFGLPWGLLWVSLSVALFAAAVYLLATRVDGVAGPSAADATDGVDPMTTLERRYARGEIDDEAFEERRIRLAERDRR